MNKTLAIIGNGKVAKALTLGFLKSGIPIQSIIIIGRNEENLSYFKEKGIDTSIKINDVSEVENIILAVTPHGVGPSMKRLRELKIQQTQKIICVCSGINTDYCAKFLEINPSQITAATINTNVEYGKGIICLSKDNETSNIFKSLGQIVFEKPEDIVKSVVSVGSMNAFDSKFIELATGNSDIKKWLADYRNSDLVKKYLVNKSAVLVSEMNYTKEYAEKRSYDSFESCISALFSIQKITLEDIKNHSKKVITKGGCTEKGISKLETLDMFMSFEDLSNAIRPVYERTLKFSDDITQSFSENE